MPTRRFLQLDVFSARPGAGNPLAVVIDAEDLDDQAMQAFAAWTNLSETIFLLPPAADADYRVRIFTPRQELPFAGHPSVGAAWAVLDAGIAQPRDGTLVQQCAAGRLPVRVVDAGDGRRIHVRAPRATLRASGVATATIDAALAGVPRGALAPALWDNGPRWWIAELADADALRTMRPDFAAITALTAAGDVGLAVFAMAGAPHHQLEVRAFCPADGIPEDPVTGSANAAVAAALLQAGRLPTSRAYRSSQGRQVGRDGVVEVRVDDQDEVWIGGRVQAVIRGTLDW